MAPNPNLVQTNLTPDQAEFSFHLQIFATLTIVLHRILVDGQVSIVGTLKWAPDPGITLAQTPVSADRDMTYSSIKAVIDNGEESMQ